MKEYIKIINIIDKSGSMSTMLESAIDGFNGFITEQKQEEGDANVSTIMFNSRYEILYQDVDIKKCDLLNNKIFIPNGTTALYDAIGITIDNEINKLGNIPIEERPIKTLCVILTDGYENASHKYSGSKIKEMIVEMKKDFNWQFIFLAANEDASFTAETIGISKGNSYSWTNSSDGLKDAYKGINYATSSYRSSVVMDMTPSEDLMDEYIKTKKD